MTDTPDSPDTCYGCEMPVAECACRFAGLGEDAAKVDDANLRPCPFCGGEADISHDHTVEESHAYGCRKCGVWFNDYLADDPIAAWNRRADTRPAPVEGLLEAAKAVRDERFSTYRAKNGREVGIEDDNGEMVWLVDHETMHALDAALTDYGESQNG